MAYDTSIQPKQPTLTSLHDPSYINTVKNCTSCALGYTVRVCSKAIRKIDLINQLAETPLEIQETSLQKRKTGYLLNDEPSQELSEQAITDLKKTSAHIRELQQQYNMQQAAFKEIGKDIELAEEVCSHTRTEQTKYEDTLQTIHKKMLKKGSDAPFIYFNRPDKEKTGHTIADNFKRFSQEAVAASDKKAQQISRLNKFHTRLSGQLQGQGGSVNLDAVKSLTNELNEMSGINVHRQTPADEEAERLPNEPADRDSSNHSSSEAMQYAEKKLQSLKILLKTTEEQLKNTMSDEEIDKKFPLAEHSYLFSDKTLTGNQYNSLVDELTTAIYDINTLKETVTTRNHILSETKKTLKKDVEMLAKVDDAEFEAKAILLEVLKIDSGTHNSTTDQRNYIASLLSERVNHLLNEDKKLESKLQESKKNTLDLLKQVQDQLLAETSASSQPVTTSLTAKQQRRQLAESIQILVDFYEEHARINS